MGWLGLEIEVHQKHNHALHPTLQSLRSFRSGERGRYVFKGQPER